MDYFLIFCFTPIVNPKAVMVRNKYDGCEIVLLSLKVFLIILMVPIKSIGMLVDQTPYNDNIRDMRKA